MSDVFYPISVIQKLRTERFDRTVSDVFDDGSTAARTGWTAQNFKRRFSLLHAPLTANEWRYLRSFHSQRSGGYDSFWFRDNVHREGNAQVRFVGSLPAEFEGSARVLQLSLEEVAARRALPEFDEVITAAGSAPLLWWDPQREIYYKHLGVEFVDPLYAARDEMGNYSAPWQAGGLSLGNVLGAYQNYSFTGTNWARSAANVSELTGAKPAFTMLCFARHSTTATAQVLASVGAAGTGSGLGIALYADNTYNVFYGNMAGTGGYSNATQNTWRSLALTTASASNFYKLYVNAAFYLTANPATVRSYGAGPAVLGAAAGGGSIANPAGAMTNANVGHVLMWAGELTLAQVKAVHNLLGYQYGLAVV